MIGLAEDPETGRSTIDEGALNTTLLGIALSTPESRSDTHDWAVAVPFEG